MTWASVWRGAVPFSPAQVILSPFWVNSTVSNSEFMTMALRVRKSPWDQPQQFKYSKTQGKIQIMKRLLVVSRNWLTFTSKSFSRSTISLEVKNYQMDWLFWSKIFVKSPYLGIKKANKCNKKLNYKWNEKTTKSPAYLSIWLLLNE